MAAQWLKQNWPNARAVDVNWTMERYCYPVNVRSYIFTNWVKVSNKNGGTYCESNYYNSLANNHPYKIHKENKEKKEEDEDEEQGENVNFFQNYKDNNPQIYNQMDAYNKKALNVGANQGEEALIRNMFKHPENGRALSYAEMRAFYG